MSLEGTFDIVSDNTFVSGEYFEAETVLVLYQVLMSVMTQSDRIVTNHPLWYLRISHTKVAESILDICGIPSDINVRNCCFQIFSMCSTYQDIDAEKLDNRQQKRIRQRKEENTRDNIETYLKGIVGKGISETASKRLRYFISCLCIPLSDIRSVLDSIECTVTQLRSKDAAISRGVKSPLGVGITSVRRLERQYDEISKGICSLRLLLKAIQLLGIDNHQRKGNSPVTPPALLLDLGIRQKKKHVRIITTLPKII